MLSWAVERGDYEAADQLLRCGADPNRCDSQGQSPLFHSIHAETSKCTRLLLEAKAVVDERENHGNTALMEAAKRSDTAFMECLIAHGANVRAVDKDGGGALHYAASYGNLEVVSFLLDKGADCNARDNDGESVMDFALLYNNYSVIEYLLHLPDFDSSGHGIFGYSFVHVVALYGDRETLAIIRSEPPSRFDLSASDRNNETALDLARRRRDDNFGWSRAMIRDPDPDPEQWYSDFEAMWKALQEAQHQARQLNHNQDHLSDTTASGDQSTEKNGPGNGEIQDGEEGRNKNDEQCEREDDVWFDAAEALAPQ